jgi:flagellar biosynthesis protein FliP
MEDSNLFKGPIKKITKENFFSRYKPLSETKVFTRSREEIQSEAVLALIKELKQFMIKNDVDGFWNLTQNNPKKKNLSFKDKQSLSRAIIAEDNKTVFDILISIHYLKEDE